MSQDQTNPFALALSRSGLPATRSVGRSFERDTSLTREEQHMARDLRNQISAMDLWAEKGRIGVGMIGGINVFAVSTFQHTLHSMAGSSHVPGAPANLQSLMDQFVEAQAMAAGTQMAQLTALAASNIFNEFNRPIFPENLPPEQVGLLRRLLGGG